jgi:hypothetical protein
MFRFRCCLRTTGRSENVTDLLIVRCLSRRRTPDCAKRRYDLLFFLGTFAPDFRASLRAMATACLRLFTFLPLPDLSLPSFITLWTLRFPFDMLRELE